MKSPKRIAVSLVVASALALSGCWMVRGNDGGGGRYRDDQAEHHDYRRDNGDQRDQQNQWDQPEMTDGPPPQVNAAERSGSR